MQNEQLSTQVQEYADILCSKQQIPLVTGDAEIDKKIAYATALLNLKFVDEAIKNFTSILKVHPNTASAHHGRGISFARKSLNQDREAAVHAINDFTRAIDLEPKAVDSYERRAEVLSMMAQHYEAVADLDTAIRLKPDDKLAKLFFQRGLEHLFTENFTESELDFRRSLAEEGEQAYVLYYLGVVLQKRGAFRNATRVFDEALQLNPSHLEVLLAQGNSYRELGDVKRSLKAFDQAYSLHPDRWPTVFYRGQTHYSSGQLQLALQDFNRCVELDSQNIKCVYMKGITHSMLGQFYESVKAESNLIVHSQYTTGRLSPEFLKAHYLKETFRYYHRLLDEPLTTVNPDRDFSGEFREKWSKTLPFQFEGAYAEQKGIQPHILDVVVPTFEQLTTPEQTLLCRAALIGQLGQVTADGYMPQERFNIAMGLAAIDISQSLQGLWSSKKSLKIGDKRVTWRDIFNIAVSYRRLAQMEDPVFWLDQFPEKSFNTGFNFNLVFINVFDVHIRVSLSFIRSQRIVFSISTVTTRMRTIAYHAELDYIFLRLSDDIRKTGVHKISDADGLSHLILSLVYYFYNLMPLTKGSSAIAYSVALGLFMSIGREVTSRIPPGKLMQFEAMLSGGQDSFIMVTKLWMKIKKSQSLSSLPLVREHLPTTRKVLEILNVGAAQCPGH
ncbi:PREDICTED: tetratricopeptide repeat protein 13-like [Priapulus caudatus]|uniref:Tetratricopeptide repeat protein 13-like n=1 Tax=Priapulus caudatus TaxID=37621 RepID=A0ABM1E220_PRICU|nr:PREDICTED: tetratricopeptide repeat protein 13-like [Priapulus caudatus]